MYQALQYFWHVYKVFLKMRSRNDNFMLIDVEMKDLLVFLALDNYLRKSLRQMDSFDYMFTYFCRSYYLNMGERGPPPKVPKLKIKHERGTIYCYLLLLFSCCACIFWMMYGM